MLQGSDPMGVAQIRVRAGVQQDADHVLVPVLSSPRRTASSSAVQGVLTWWRSMPVWAESKAGAVLLARVASRSCSSTVTSAFWGLGTETPVIGSACSRRTAPRLGLTGACAALGAEVPLALWFGSYRQSAAASHLGSLWRQPAVEAIRSGATSQHPAMAAIGLTTPLTRPDEVSDIRQDGDEPRGASAVTALAPLRLGLGGRSAILGERCCASENHSGNRARCRNDGVKWCP